MSNYSFNKLNHCVHTSVYLFIHVFILFLTKRMGLERLVRCTGHSRGGLSVLLTRQSQGELSLNVNCAYSSLKKSCLWEVTASQSLLLTISLSQSIYPPPPLFLCL